MSLVPSPRSQRAARRDIKRRRKTNTALQPNSIFETPITQQPPQCNMSNMAYGVPSTACEPTYSETRARFCFNYQRVTSDQTRTDSIRHSPLISLAVKYAVDNPGPKLSDGSKDASAAVNSFGGTSSSGSNLFGGTPAPAPASQQLQLTTGSTDKSIPSRATLFGEPSLSFAPFSQYGTTTSNQFPSEAPKASHTGGLFGQAPNSQHKRQAPSQNPFAPSGSEPKIPKLKAESSPTNGILATNGPPSNVPLFGRPANGSATPGFSFSNPQLNVAANSATGSGLLNFNFGSYREPSEQPSTFAKPSPATTVAKPVNRSLTLPQYGLLGFDLDNCDTNGNPEPILLNTNSPSSVFLCGSQGSGKSYTLSCMLENHILHDPGIGAQRETIPGFVFHWDTNTSGFLAEAASLCSRGIKVRLLVSWSNYQQMKKLYEDFARKVGGQIEVRPLLFEDTELTVSHIRNLMAFRDGPTETPLYLEVIQNILRRLGRKSEPFSVKTFLGDLAAAGLSPPQLQMLDQRLSILKTFSAATAPDIVEQDHKNLNPKGLERERIKQRLGFKGNCITVERGTLTIIDLSDPFVDASTACILFDICLAIILKRHKEAITANKIKPGLIVTLDEAHKFLDKNIPSADVFTSSLLTTIREQRHNAARVIIATQEPTISEKLLDLCSISIVHRFNSPAWFTALCGHLGAASTLAGEEKEDDVKTSKAKLFERIIALQTGESLVFSPTSFVRGGAQAGGGDVVEPMRLGSGVLRMKTRERKGEDSGKTWNVV
jgi:hypothetical protein